MRFLGNLLHRYINGGVLVVLGIVACVVIFVITTRSDEGLPDATISNSKEILAEDMREYGENTLSPKESEDLQKKDPRILSLSEARDFIIEHSEEFETPDQVDSLIKLAVEVECDIDGDLRYGTGVLMAYPNDKTGEWFVYTNAHITGTDPKKIRMCRVSILHSADSDIYNKTDVDIYEATVVSVAEGFPDVDFAKLRLIGFEVSPEQSLWRCSYGDNLIGDKVVLIGYPNGLTISSGIIIGTESSEASALEVIKTTAGVYPGHSGGMAYNLTNDCSIGLVTWSEDETFFGLIQSWETFEL